MRKHILSSVAQTVEAIKPLFTYYDFKSQVSYIDKDFKKKIVSLYVKEKRIETRTLEDSNPDEFRLNGNGSKKTFTLENSDPDEFTILTKTTVTKTLESSDLDEFYIS